MNFDDIDWRKVAAYSAFGVVIFALVVFMLMAFQGMAGSRH